MRRSLYWILGFAALLYLALSPRYDVGHFGDDARDLLAAQALLHYGSYSNLQLPSHPPLNFPLPGFALLLVPFAALFQHAFAAFKIVPILLCLTAIYLISKLWKDDLSSTALAILAAAFALNPTTIALSSTVISDAPYLVMLLLAFVLLRHPPGARRDLLLSITLAWAVLLRPEGILLLACVALGLAWTEQKKTLLGLVAPFGLWVFVLVWNHLRTGSSSGYLSIFQQSLPMLSQGLGALAAQSWTLLKLVVLDTLCGLSFEAQSAPLNLLIACMVGTVFFFTLAGAARWVKSRETPPAIGVALGLYVFFHLWIHDIWLAVDAHYIWPILPYLLFFIVYEVDHCRNARLKKAAGIGLVGLTVLVYGWQLSFAIEQTIERPPENRLARQSLAWIQEHLPTDVYLLTPVAPEVSLYTGRYALAFIDAYDPDGFRYRILKERCTHVLLHPIHVLYVQTASQRGPEKGWERESAWIKADPEAYPLVYQNPPERVLLYRIQPDAAFLRAYEQFKSTIAMAQGPAPDWEAQLQRLEAVIKIDPFPSALNAYGVAALFSGRNLMRARRRLEEAVRRRPDDAIIRMNLARIYQRLGETKSSGGT